MRQLTRRRALALFGTTALIAGCAALKSVNWQAMLQSIGQDWAAVSGELAELGVDVNVTIALPGGGTTTVSGLAALVTKVTGGISAASTATEGQNALVIIEGYVNVLVPVIWPVVQPMIATASPGAGLTLGLIVADLPAIEAAINFATDLTADALQLAKLAPTPASARYHA